MPDKKEYYLEDTRAFLTEGNLLGKSGFLAVMDDEACPKYCYISPVKFLVSAENLMKAISSNKIGGSNTNLGLQFFDNSEFAICGTEHGNLMIKLHNWNERNKVVLDFQAKGFKVY